MSLEFTHKPNYFFHAQSLINFLVNHLQKNQSTELKFRLIEIYHVFREDFAATTANLEGILNIADNYGVGSKDHEHLLISSYHINAEDNHIVFHFNPQALAALAQGLALIAPDATSYE